MMKSDVILKGFSIVNLSDMISELEEDRVKDILLDFCCPINKDVENFYDIKQLNFRNNL